MRVLCSSRKPMRKTPVSGFPRALLSLSHARKRRALASRLVFRGPREIQLSAIVCRESSGRIPIVSFAIETIIAVALKKYHTWIIL